MGHESGIITAPIGYAPDIYKTLGIGKTSRGYDIIYACANTHGKINMWAKFKPTRAGGTPVTPADWWKGPDGRCGLGIPVYSTPGNLDSGFVHDMISGAARWTYEAPRPGIDHCRATDFEGYNHNAGNPFGAIESDVYIQQNSRFVLRMTSPFLQAQGQLTEKDIALPDGLKLTEMYPGVLLWNGLTAMLRTGNDKASRNLITIANVSPGQKWNALPILCSEYIDGTVGVVAKYLATGCSTVSEVTLISRSDLYYIIASGSMPVGGRMVDATVMFTNNSAEAYIFKSSTVMVATKREGTEIMQAVGTKSLGDVTVAAKSSQGLSVTIPIISAIGEQPTYYIGAGAETISPRYTIVSVYQS